MHFNTRIRVNDSLYKYLAIYSTWFSQKSNSSHLNELFVIYSYFEDCRFLMSFSSPKLLLNA